MRYHSIYAPSVVKLCLVLMLFGAGNLARGDASGGYDAPYFQADFTENLSEWTSALVNPALLYRVNQMHIDIFGVYRWSWFNESMGYQHFGALFPIRKNHTLGLTLLFSRGIVEKTVDGPGNNPIDLGAVSFQDLWAIGNYGVRVLPWLMLGTNVKLRIQNQYGNMSVSHIPGLDLGIYLNPLDHYRFGDLGISLSVQDLLPTQVKWDMSNDPEITINRFRAGIRYAAFNDNLVGDVEVLIDNLLGQLYESIIPSYKNMFKGLKNDSGTLDGAIPIEYRLGVHLKYMFIPQLWIKAGWTNNNIPYLGFNYNLIYPLPEMINYLNVDADFGYSFIESLMKNGDKRDERGFTVAFKVSTDFGPTREQRESKRLYDELILAPMDAYNEAMRLYLAGKYWEASFAFGKVLSLFPNFHLNDKATWYLGNSYRFLYMNDIARQVYKEALEEYTTSEMRSKYLYGLQSLDYREENYEEALKNHAFIINLYGESDIRPDADYLAGQIHFQRKNYNVAEQLLSSIAPGDPNYLYAQYTLSIINIEDDKEQAAVQNLTNIVQDTTQEVADQLLQDAANTKLGHLYFEMGDKLRLAVEAYQRVPDGSPYQDEALLGTAWAWIKVNQPNVALKTIEKLISSFPESPLVPEAFLVKGYSLMLLKRHQEAVSALEQCIATCNRPFITDEDLAKRKALFEEYTTHFATTADLIKKNALRKPTNKTLEERPALQKEFEGFAKENKDFFRYSLLANSHKKFFKRQEEILADADYALAKATKIIGAKKEAQIIQEQEKEEGKIDQELEKLQKQLEKIEE
ncbi:MAG: tetratricopeptide repeat protein [Fibrobacter sp.]|nr:tetratricopeptide repeat protein [Fibrobacter sp.]